MRVSADYAYNFAQWTIGLTSLIADNLGMAPHKDTFYTVREMPDNNNFAPENYPDLHSAVATLRKEFQLKNLFFKKKKLKLLKALAR